MADNVAITAGSGTTIATDDAGAGGHVQLFKQAISTDGSVTLVPADAANGLDVDVTRLPALVASSANIGDVDVLTMPKAATATLANVSGSASSVTLQASNAARLGWMMYNDSTALCYVKFGSAASSTSFTVPVAPGQFYELPGDGTYTGIITGIWTSATGSARVTELTA